MGVLETALSPPMFISGSVSILECSLARSDKPPAIERYWRRLGARPVALRATEIDEALAAGRSATFSSFRPNVKN